MIGPKPMVERFHARMVRAAAMRSADRRATGRARCKGAIHQPVNPIARQIVDDHEMFAFDGHVLQVESRVRSKSGFRSDVILVRSYVSPHWKQNPYLQAIQFSTLERYVEEGRVSFPIDLRTRASVVLSTYNKNALAALDNDVAGGRE